MRDPSPDPSYHIDADARARLLPEVDADALERLLQHFAPSTRQRHIEMFSQPNLLSARRRGAGSAKVLTSISNPYLQRLLDAVWKR